MNRRGFLGLLAGGAAAVASGAAWVKRRFMWHGVLGRMGTNLYFIEDPRNQKITSDEEGLLTVEREGYFRVDDLGTHWVSL